MPTNDYLDYALAMAVGDGLLKSTEYVTYLRKVLQEVDLEAEYDRIAHYKDSKLSSAMRRRVVALVTYVRAKENKGPSVVAEKGIGCIGSVFGL